MDNNEECPVKVVKVKQGKKYHLNILMTIAIILLMKINFTNLVWHEVIGTGLFAMFFIHHIYNFKYTIQIIKKFFSKK